MQCGSFHTERAWPGSGTSLALTVNAASRVQLLAAWLGRFNSSLTWPSLAASTVHP